MFGFGVQSTKARFFTPKQRACTRATGRNSLQVNAFFKFGGSDAQKGGIVGDQGRDEYTDLEVEYYYNYMGMLAESGSYDDMKEVLKSGLHPCDIILLWAAENGDDPKVEEVLEAGADINVKDRNGKTPLELATKPEVIDILKAKLNAA